MILRLSAVLLFVLTVFSICPAQPNNQTPSQPLNSSVSGFGTSFTFGPTPICAGCVETELGFLSVQNGRFMPTVISVAPFDKNLDISFLVNVLDSTRTSGKRISHFGNRVDLIVRRKVLDKSGFVLTIAPQGTVFIRGIHGGRVGGTLVGQYSKDKNAVVLNLTLTRSLGRDLSNPKLDYVTSFDYSRTLSKKGVSVFAGFQHEKSTGNKQIIGTEQGLVVPFRNGQVEFAVEQLNLNIKPVWQFQTRVIVNWGKIFHK